METVNGISFVALGVGAGDFKFSSSWVAPGRPEEF
jgi:hypothetical protein